MVYRCTLSRAKSADKLIHSSEKFILTAPQNGRGVRYYI